MTEPLINLPEDAPYGAEPVLLDAGKGIIAHKLHRHYTLRFPFCREGTEIVRSLPTARWSPAGGGEWSIDAFQYRGLRKAMLRIASLLPDTKIAKTQSGNLDIKVTVLLERGLICGDLLHYKRKPVIIDRLGSPFLADARWARHAKGELVGKQVRYAYCHSASPAEIALIEERRAIDPRPADPDYAGPGG